MYFKENFNSIDIILYILECQIVDDRLYHRVPYENFLIA